MSRRDRYARQIAVPGVGDEGQVAIGRARAWVRGRELDAEICARYLVGAGLAEVEVDPALVAPLSTINDETKVVGRVGEPVFGITLHLAGRGPTEVPAHVLGEGPDLVFRGSASARWVLARILEHALSAHGERPYAGPVRAFDVDLEPSILEEIAAHAESEFPNEACGLVLGSAGAGPHRVVRLANVQDRLHQERPDAFPATARDAFHLDPLEHARVLEAAEREGLRAIALYHSHADAGAYLSPDDRAALVKDGVELLPGLVHLVISVRNGRRADLAAYRFDAAGQRFLEERSTVFQPASATGLPDLVGRALDGHRGSNLVRPLGGSLIPRRITAAERAALAGSGDRARLRIRDAEVLRDLERFELGLYSPLSGFMRSVEVRSIEQSGRLLSGTPWRTPLVLELALEPGQAMPAPGALVELEDADGRPRAAIGVEEVLAEPKHHVRLGGPIFVFDEGRRDAADVRAALIARGAKRVLAIGPGHLGRADRADLSEFDAVLAPRAIAGAKAWLELPLAGRDPWLDAMMAQNLGASHVWTEDAALARAIEDTLALACWRPRTGKR